MELKFNNKNTKVQQLTDFIQRSIAARELKVGDKLPSINELSQKFHLSRDTVFKAFADLKSRGIIDSIHGKNYYVASHTKNILLLLDEYTPFKEVMYNTLRERIPSYYEIDLWFHQYNEHLFNQIISNSAGMHNSYLVMNYHNEKFSEALTKIDKKKLLLIDFGKFDKNGYSYVCQDFDTAFYKALETIKTRLKKYRKLFFVFNKYHKHPQSSKEYFSKFCIDNNLPFEIIDEITDKTIISKNAFYLVIKQEDLVTIIRKGRLEQLKAGRDYGLLAYNENPFYEVIENGIASIGVNWEKMGNLAADFVMNEDPVQEFLPTEIILRDSL
ncbi:MAG: GntR family transcriptional regulator [Proteiniphilum sp.]|uniref:GntR family transcriptional regulator n=1 Tax=Proteiniphilum sp. TaxID=1926877 RepID=UPI002ABB9364|nr:GntR family transcriptional regulator [Proteiniphilum sp.]MDY9917764.1 GntR family transcriptional regulator [Proteiniphilum sp.]